MNKLNLFIESLQKREDKEIEIEIHKIAQFIQTLVLKRKKMEKIICGILCIIIKKKIIVIIKVKV